MKKIIPIILAAGKGSRMNSNVPKVLELVNGKPMIKWILETVSTVTKEIPIIVLNYRKEMIMNELGNNYIYAIQNEINGTAKAVEAATFKISDNDCICLIIPGDLPLIKDSILKSLINEHIINNYDLSFLTTSLEEELNYGRVITKDGKYYIKEYRDLLDIEKNINEVNVGVYCVNYNVLIEEIKNIENKNVQKEYYFTDIIGLTSEKYKVLK